MAENLNRCGNCRHCISQSDGSLYCIYWDKIIGDFTHKCPEYEESQNSHAIDKITIEQKIKTLKF